MKHSLERSLSSRLKFVRRKLRSCDGLPLVFTIAEAAKLVESSPPEIERLIAEARVQTTQRQGQRLIAKAEVERLWIEIFSRR